MSALLNKAAGHIPPIAGNVTTLAHSTSATRHEIPDDWYDNYVTFQSSTSTLYVLFGDGGVVASATAVGLTASEVTAPHASSAWPITAGSSENWVVPPKGKGITHYSVISDAASGNWEAYKSCGDAARLKAELPTTATGLLAWLDASDYASMTVSSGDIIVWNGRSPGSRATFSGSGGAPPAWDSAVASATLIRPSAAFVAADSEVLESTDAGLLAALSGTGAYTIAIAFSRATTAANHCLFSAGTAGTNNGRLDIQIDASDDLVLTRVTGAGASTTSTYATTVAAGTHTLIVTFDGATPLAWLDRTSVTLSGTAAGDVGTLTVLGLGARLYNTSSEDQYLNGEISDCLIFDHALPSAAVDNLNDWLLSRIGV